MDIKDVQSAKQQLQNQISELLVNFSRDTGLSISEMNIEEIVTMGYASRYIVTVEVKL